MDFATETEANDPTETYDYPSPDWSPAMPTADATLFAAINANSYSGNIIDAGDVFNLITDGDTENDPFIISCRSAADYAKGHVAGAVNISLGSLADNLDRIPPDGEVVVYCYTGQSAAQATALLRILDYDAKSMKFGMCAWSSDPEINAGKCFNSANVAGYATVASE
jgi:rhodanese-related sulfurtransferase